MEVRATLFSLTLLVVALLGGCEVGEYGETQAMTPDATMMQSNPGEASFNSMIKPLVTSCTGCHGQGQTQPTLTSFTALQMKYKTKPGDANVLVTKGAHSGNPYFNATDKATVQAWINSL